MPAPVYRTFWSTRDPHEAASAMVPVYGQVRAEALSAAPFSMSIATTEAGPVGLRRTRVLGGSTRFRVEESHELKIGHAVVGSLLLDTGETRVEVGDRPVLFPQEPFDSMWGPVDLNAVILDGQAVQDYARELLDDPGFRLRFTGHTPLPGPGAERWTSTAERLERRVLGNEEAMSLPLVREHAFRTAADALLACFPSTFSCRTAPGDGAPLPAVVRRAIAHIEAHLDAPLGVGEIAAAARVSPHGLLVAFRRHLGTTPGAYLRSVRLDAAHRELVAADPAGGVTVEQVARRWGFVHPADFVLHYRARYGQAPETTLRG